LKHLNSAGFTEEDLEEFEKLNVEWRNSAPKGRPHE
jgi:hypothetical protein